MGMALSPKQLSESTDSVGAPHLGPPGRVRLLFHDYLTSETEHIARWHSHEHWQGELAVKGPFEVRMESGVVELRTGDFCLLPPGTNHEFMYPAHEVTWITTRFVAPEYESSAAPIIVPDDATSRGLVKTLARCLGRGGTAPVPRDRAVAEHCLAALVSYGYVSAEPEDSASDMPPHVRDAIMHIAEHATQRTTVDGVAEAVGYSKSYLAAEFRKHTGENMKMSIDRTRADAASRLLLYSDHSITEISALMGFVDVYSFSRFFSRMMGKSPRAYRRQQTKSHASDLPARST